MAFSGVELGVFKASARCWPARKISRAVYGEMPFAWVELGDQNEFLGVAVMFACWMIVWPLFECELPRYSEKLNSWMDRSGKNATEQIGSRLLFKKPDRHCGE